MEEKRILKFSSREAMSLFKRYGSSIRRSAAASLYSGITLDIHAPARALPSVFSALTAVQSLLSLASYYLSTFPRTRRQTVCSLPCSRFLARRVNVSVRRMRSGNDRVCIPGRRAGERLGEKLITGWPAPRQISVRLARNDHKLWSIDLRERR